MLRYNMNTHYLLAIENDIDANHPSVKNAVKRKITTGEGDFDAIVVVDQDAAMKICREMRPLKIDFTDRAAVLAWLKQNDATKTGLTGRAARYIEWQAGDRTESGREMAAQVANSPWYAARAYIERQAKEREA